MRFATALMEQAEALSAFTEDAPRITRAYLTDEHRRAGEYIAGLMRAAGLIASFDVLGNVVGRREAQEPGAPVVMTGSHFDSVRHAGKYDGLFGILSAIACARDLAERGVSLPYTLEIVAFGDEEGVRFGTALLGSKAMAGRFDAAWLDREDERGITLREALRRFGVDPDAWPSVDRRGRNVAAYVESHIEQGPVLLNEGLPVGVVTTIAAGSRLAVRVTGLAGHAGTVPMSSRRDALAAACEMALEVERHCTANAGLVGTVGKMSVSPGAINVIPQETAFTIDVRSGDDRKHRDAVAALHASIGSIAQRRNVEVDVRTIYSVDATPCDASLQARLADSIAAHGLPVRRLPSGAGHDAMSFSGIAPVAMLFVRCGNNGISHHPDETMTSEDAEIGTSVLLHFLEHFDVRGAR